MTSSSLAEFNALQVSFNTALRVFMKSPGGDAWKLIKQYDHLKKMSLDFLPKRSTSTVNIAQTFDSEWENKNFAYKIIKLMQNRVIPIQGFIHSFVIHGSYATQDFIPNWSDLDTMVILKNQAFDSVDNLLKVKEVFLRIGLLCYWIDPLAHHQLSFITEFDLSYYSQSFLPLPSYEHAVLLLGQKQINFNIREDVIEQAEIIERFRNWFRFKIKNKDWSQNQYDWKNDLAHILLLPSLFLQARDVYVYKKESFVKVKQFFNDFDTQPIQEATDIMRKWEVPNLVKYLPPKLTIRLPYRLSRIIVTLARKPALSMRPTQSLVEIEKLTRKFLDLYLYEYKK